MKPILILTFIILFTGCSDMSGKSSADKIRYIQELGNSEDPNNAEKIFPYLADKDSEVVMSASFNIGYVKGRKYINDLVRLLDSDNEKIVNMAGSGLAEMVDERDEIILPKLYLLLEHKFNLVRLSAIEAIGAIKSPTSVPALIQLFGSSSSGQKARIIEALGNIGAPNALPLLNNYLIEVKNMDHSVPNKGGIRGADLHPDALQVITEEAINAITAKNA